MTAALAGVDPKHLVGSMTPRIFTPPLAENCHVDGAQEYCLCGCGLSEKTSWGFSCVDFLTTVCGWKLIPYQKWLYWHALEKGKDGAGFRFQTLCILIARQNGKALDADTPVLTTGGFKRLGDIQAGDRVYHPDGHPVEVVAAHETRYDRPCYEVTTTDGRTVVADADHQWAVRDTRTRNRDWRVVTTQDMIDGGLYRTGRERRWELPRVAPLQTKPVDLPVEPWLLGAWLGDGSSTSARIYCSDDDAPHMIDAIAECGATVTSARRHKTAWAIGFNTGAMRDGFESRCRRLEVWGNKHIPELYLTASADQRLALLRGLMDTDGTISRAGQAEFCSTNKNLAEGVLYLARSLGWQATIKEHRALLNGRDCGPKYRVFWSPTPDLSPFSMPRKTERIRRRKQRAIRIASITQVPTRPVRCLTVDSPDGRWVAGRDLMPTHNTAWLRGLGMWRLFLSRIGKADKTCPGARLAVIAAQNLDYSEATLREVVEEIRENPLLCKELINHRVTNGKHRAILTNRRVWRAATATRKGGRSLSVDIAMLDELREHTNWDAWNAIVPTTTARTYSQVICTSNAGDQRSEVLRALRDGAMRKVLTGETQDTRTGLFEWSVPMEEDPRDPQFWHLANPAMGMLNDFSINDLLGFFEAMEHRNLPGFQTEHLCQWVDALEPGILPAEHWMETLDPNSRRDPDMPVYAAVDVNYERSRSYVSVAALRPDGNVHIEVVAAARGTDWVTEWLLDRKDRFAGITVQKTGAPASGLIPELERAGIKVTAWGPQPEVARACGDFYDAVVEHRIYHRPAPVLDRAAASGIARSSGEAWIFDRRNSPVDISPLMACVGATWLALEPPPKPPEVHLWPEDDIIQQWEREGADMVKNL